MVMTEHPGHPGRCNSPGLRCVDISGVRGCSVPVLNQGSENSSPCIIPEAVTHRMQLAIEECWQWNLWGQRAGGEGTDICIFIIPQNHNKFNFSGNITIYSSWLIIQYQPFCSLRRVSKQNEWGMTKAENIKLVNLYSCILCHLI